MVKSDPEIEKGMKVVLVLASSLLSLVAVGCGEGEAPPADPQYRMFLTYMPGQIATDTPIQVGFQWDRLLPTGGPWTIRLQLLDQNEVYLKGLTAVFGVPAQESGSGTFDWDGRMPAVGTGQGRRVPVPPGSYKIGPFILFSDPTFFRNDPLTVVANNWDGDSDDISDAVEDENNGVTGMQTPIIDENGNTQYGWYVRTNGSLPPTIPTTISSSNLLYPNRGTHDYSIAQGTRGTGCLHNGLRIVDQSSGYRYFPNTDPTDSDNWATLMLINEVERVGRQWNASHPTYPMTTLDMSLATGGSFPPHNGHQNGLDIDIMYIGTGPYQYGVFILTTGANYDRARSQELIQMFDALPTVYRIWTSDEIIVNISTTDKIEFQTGHIDHFHVDFIDPDGSQSCQ